SPRVLPNREISAEQWTWAASWPISILATGTSVDSLTNGNPACSKCNAAKWERHALLGSSADIRRNTWAGRGTPCGRPASDHPDGARLHANNSRRQGVAF